MKKKLCYRVFAALMIASCVLIYMQKSGFVAANIPPYILALTWAPLLFYFYLYVHLFRNSFSSPLLKWGWLFVLLFGGYYMVGQLLYYVFVLEFEIGVSDGKHSAI